MLYILTNDGTQKTGSFDAKRRAKQRVISFLLRHNFIYPGKKPWSKTYFIWLGKVELKHPAQKITLQEYIEVVHECSERLARLSEQISLAVEEWRRLQRLRPFRLYGVFL